MGISSIFQSLGIKRYITALVGLFISVASAVPALAPLVVLLTKLSAALGIVGVTHGTASGTILTQLPATLASIVVILLAIAEQVPSLTPFVPVLKLILAALGGATVAKGLKTNA